MVKRVLSLFVSILTTLCLTITVAADDFANSNFKQSDTDSRYYILTSVPEGTENLTVPNEYNGSPVGIFGDYSMGDIFLVSGGNVWENVKSVTLSENIYSMQRLTLCGEKETYLTQYENGWYVGTKDNPYYALNQVIDTTATEFVLHKDTQIIAAYAFSGMSNLENLVLSDSVKYIHPFAFNGVDEYSETTFYKNLKLNIYGNCRYLGSETNPYYALISIDSQDVTEIDVHKDTKIIMCNAFSYLSNKGVFIGGARVEKVTVPKSVISVGQNAFSNCENLKEVNFEAESIADIKICEIALDMPENITVNWNCGSNGEDISDTPAEDISTSDTDAATDGGNGNNTILIIAIIAGVIAGGGLVLYKIKKK